MVLQSAILKGNERLERAANGGPSIKKRPPDDDPDAVRRIQNALVTLKFLLPKSFPEGPTGPPDGVFGDETYWNVMKFQKQAFPSKPVEWDGRVGRNTLTEMDRRLPQIATPTVLTMSALAEQDKTMSMSWAQAALDTLTAVAAFLEANGDSLTPTNFQPPIVRRGLRALETHFRLSTIIPANGTTLEHIAFIASNFLKTVNVLIFSRTHFIDDTTTAEAPNGTPAHVPFGKGKVNFTPAFRKFDAATGEGFGDKCRAAMVLHEPVHIVDHPLASTPATHVHENSPQYALQTAVNQIHNAHSYACFGQHCFFGRDTRFGIGKRDQ